MGIQDFNRLREKYRLSPRHTVAQLTAYSAAKVLVQGLKLAGKDLSREKLVTSLETLYQFDTGLTPHISYGPNRRVGALGAHVVAVDPGKKSFAHVSGWMTP
jgi:ABC-type branched-subunit amino acid transport system substrate-binding protein